MNNQLSSYVDIKLVTWLKDSHGLFDYESRNISLTRLKVESASNIYKDESNIVIQNSKNPQSLGCLNSEPDHLFCLTSDNEKNGRFSITPVKNKTISASNYPFLVVRSLKNDQNIQKGYELDVGDVVRFGRVEYRVLEYRDDKSQLHSIHTKPVSHDDPTFNMETKICTLDESVKKQCRICLMDEHDTPEILVNPCSCKGTSEYVHVQCLHSWINTKMKKKSQPDVNCIYWKKLNCEVCKVPLPDFVDLQGKKFELVPFERPDSPYIILERLFCNETKDNSGNSKMIILLNLVNLEAQIKLGRGRECEVRENDISVSRFHAYLKFQNGKFAIYDNNSKFGTLVRLRQSYLIEKKKIALQIGRTVMAFSLKSHPLMAKPLRQLIIEKPKQQLMKISNLRPFSLNDCSEKVDVNFKGNFLD